VAQRKPKPGKGYLHQKNILKRQNLAQATKYIDYLEGEVEAMQYDPDTVIGKFFNQYRELYGQNSRLSVLAACLLKKLGEKVQLTKEEMESFRGNRIKISWTLPEGVEKVEDAATYIFTYELQPDTPGPITVAPTETPTPEVTASSEEGAPPAKEDLAETDSTEQDK
jgi:hypothetical protein